MIDCVVVSNKFLVSNIARRISTLNVRVIKSDTLNRIVHKVGVLIVDISDYEGFNSQFNRELNRVRSLASVIIGILPSNDYEVYRHIDVHFFDDVVVFPFSPKNLKETISKPRKPFIKTLKKKNDFEAGDFEGITSSISNKFECEVDLLYTYESLLITGDLAKAEEVVSQYYKTEQIPYHPKVKYLQALTYGDSRDGLIDTLKQNIKNFYDNPEYLYLLMVFGVDVDERLIKDFYLKIPSFPVFLHHIPDFNMELVNECLLKRKFELVFNADKGEIVSCILLALKIKDYQFVKFALKNIKKIPFPFLFQGILKLMFEDKLEEIRELKHVVMFDFDNGREHLNFLRSNYKIRGARELIYQSSFILGAKDNKGRLQGGIKNISESLDDITVLNSYLLGLSLF
ncbi:hypothetical protein [Vibrio tasmaniensis]|uniref:hypothetical protein n=1 Tax=Vibrio tasmaniensis TaxID=212663 RepID=UPI00107F42D5|nr:hypothetical protein [Vibrio tasmaniensis]